jgi:hypothetical protein
MNSLNKQIHEYQYQLSKGHIQKAYKGIMAFMSSVKSNLERNYPDYVTSALYFGYMDMTYFAFTPPNLKAKKLKIAIVYIHKEGRFEAWLGGNNRKIQVGLIEHLSEKEIGKYRLSHPAPGVDSIIESVLVDKPDFDEFELLTKQIEDGTIAFIHDMTEIINA